MAVPILSDGTPLTYEWLNQLAQAVNTLSVQNEDDSNVQFAGDIKGQDVQVVTGTKKVNVTSGKASGSRINVPNIPFPKAFKDKNVTVIAMVSYKASKGNTVPKAAAITVAEVTDKNFDAVIQLLGTDKSFGKINFEIKYVAIGKKQVTAS